MNREVIRRIARKNRTTVQEVRSAMQDALDHADKNACHNEIAKKHLEHIYRDKPHTPENFMLGTVAQIKKQENKRNT